VGDAVVENLGGSGGVSVVDLLMWAERHAESCDIFKG
jgi:hypothetical protein